MRIGVRATAALVAAAALVAVLPTAQASTAPETVHVDEGYGQQWSYRVLPLPHDAPSDDFADPATVIGDDWLTARAPFHSAPGYCPFAWGPEQLWPVNSWLLARRAVELPSGATNVRVVGTVDNDADIFWNGALVSTSRAGNCRMGSIDASVSAGTDVNVLAVRGYDYGVVSYLDVKVIYDRPADITPPTITASIDPSPNPAGWNRTSVTVSFACTDDSPVDCPPDVELTGDGVHEGLTGTATDAYGNTSTTVVPTVRIDTTPPVVSFTGGDRSYQVDETVSVTCTATDDRSGVATHDCAEQGITRPAYELAAGEYTVTAHARDWADNESTASATFTVEPVDAQALGRLVASFSDRAGVTEALLATLAAAETAPTQESRAGVLEAFAHQVRAQSGKALTHDEAAVLLRLVASL